MTNTVWCNIHNRSDVDSCQVCEDEAGPDPILVRYFICEASIKQSDLTDNGEYPEGESWQEMEGQIRDRLLTWSGYHSAPFLTLKYWGWEPQDCPLCGKVQYDQAEALGQVSRRYQADYRGRQTAGASGNQRQKEKEEG